MAALYPAPARPTELISTSTHTVVAQPGCKQEAVPRGSEGCDGDPTPSWTEYSTRVADNELNTRSLGLQRVADVHGVSRRSRRLGCACGGSIRQGCVFRPLRICLRGGRSKRSGKRVKAALAASGGKSAAAARFGPAGSAACTFRAISYLFQLQHLMRANPATEISLPLTRHTDPCGA